ncbi:MAG: methyltransferase domain-containing protein, partial [Gemmataceae bacterium]
QIQNTNHFKTQSLRFSDDCYLDHETWIRPAFVRLGDLAGRTALDYGCGHGMASVVMARRGATVTAFDLSAEYVAEARRRAADNGVLVQFAQADGHALPFADASFDAVWGNAILHHLDLAIAGRELRRVLRPGGVAVFCEPWGENPLLRWARRRLPYPGKERTRDEEPLRAADLAGLRQSFPDVQVDGFQLLTMVRRVIRIRPLLSMLEACDRRLLRSGRAQKWCRYVVLTMRRG